MDKDKAKAKTKTKTKTTALDRKELKQKKERQWCKKCILPSNAVVLTFVNRVFTPTLLDDAAFDCADTPHFCRL